MSNDRQLYLHWMPKFPQLKKTFRRDLFKTRERNGPGAEKAVEGRNITEAAAGR